MKHFDLSEYQSEYRYIKFRREDGILEIRLHEDDGPARWSSGPTGIHNELGQALYNVGRDTGNEVVILTGSGASFMSEFDHGPVRQTWTPTVWDRIYKEGRDLLTNLLDIEVPVIGAVNGTAFIHAELVLLSDIVIASDTAVFADKAHFPGGVVPGDGVHVWWPMLLGPNRGRYFLLTGQEINAQDALGLGIVSEVLPSDKLLERAWALARDVRRRPRLVRRYTRVALVQHLKRRLLDDLGYGLALEGSAISVKSEPES